MNKKVHGITAGFLVAFAAMAGAAGYYPQLKAYLYSPEVFADRPLGSLSADSRIPTGAPYRSLWYVKSLAPLSFANLPDLMEIVKAREVPGLDFSGQRDIMDPDMNTIAKAPLRYLNLSGTRVSDRGLVNLFPLRDDLEVLLLNTDITDEGISS